MPDHLAPTVAERQRVERLVAAVMSGLDGGQAVGTATDRLGITTAVMLGEAVEDLYNEPEGEPINTDAPEYRRYFALSELFEAMARARPSS